MATQFNSAAKKTSRNYATHSRAVSSIRPRTHGLKSFLGSPAASQRRHSLMRLVSNGQCSNTTATGTNMKSDELSSTMTPVFNIAQKAKGDFFTLKRKLTTVRK